MPEAQIGRKKNVPILYVDGFNPGYHGAFEVTGSPTNPGKKLIILTPDADPYDLAKNQVHEWGHNVRLNHVGEENLMADENHASNFDISTSIDEIDNDNPYTMPPIDGRNQVYHFEKFDGWP